MLANLEGSTLLKRLKAASRLQAKVGGRISDQVSAAFGVAGYRLGNAPAKVLGEMSEQEAKASHDVSLIMDDMHAYFERRRFMRFKTVLDEMRQQDVVGSLRTLGDEVKKENGLSIAAVRILVGHARPLGRRPGRSGRLAARATPSRRAASPLPWCWRHFRSWKARSTFGKRHAWPSRRSPRSWPTITSSRPTSSPGRKRG